MNEQDLNESIIFILVWKITSNNNCFINKIVVLVFIQFDISLSGFFFMVK